MNKFSFVLIITFYLNLSSADDNYLSIWSWDNCKDQLNVYSNQISSFKIDADLFECPGLLPYEKMICEEKERLNTKPDFIKNFYQDCVMSFESFKKENKNKKCDNECYMQNFCKRFNQVKKEYDQQYTNYLKYQHIYNCRFYNIQNCDINTMQELEYQACQQNEKTCCQTEQFDSMFFYYSEGENYYLALYISFYILYSYLLIPILIAFIIYDYKRDFETIKCISNRF